MRNFKFLIILFLSLCLEAQSINFRPLTIKVIKEDVWITVISSKPWILSWSGDMKNWIAIDSDIPYNGEIQIKVLVDKGWAGMAKFSYYKIDYFGEYLNK